MNALGLEIGLDGNLLVSDGATNQVKRYDSATGGFIDVFASSNLAGPAGMTIHEGVLYVTNSNPPQGVQRFDAATGVNTGNFVPRVIIFVVALLLFSFGVILAFLGKAGGATAILGTGILCLIFLFLPSLKIAETTTETVQGPP